MAQNYRNQSGRSDHGRGDYYRTSSDHDRYRTGGEQRFNPDWEDREQSFAGDRSYSAGGYSEEFGYRRGRSQDENERGGNDQERGFRESYFRRGGYGRDRPREEASRFDEGNRWSEGMSGQNHSGSDVYDRSRRGNTSSWHEDEGDRGGYFGTGNYIDDGDRGITSDFYRTREQQMRFGSDVGSRERSRGGYGSSSPYRSDYSSYAGSQSFRGRGPQGYQRSDARLKELICERLTDDPAIDASNITIDVTAQVVKLTGTVDDRRTKYEIEELIENFGGVKDIDNQLRVQSSSFGHRGGQSGQQLRGGSDWEPGSSSLTSTGSTNREGSASPASTQSSSSTGKRT